MRLITVNTKLLVLSLFSISLLMGCTYNEENLNRYKQNIRTSKKFITLQQSSAEEYEKTMSKQQWELIWSDEFDYNGLPDKSKWGYDVIDPDPAGVGWGNHERQDYTFKNPKNARVENGTLIIEARKEGRYSSARLVTRGKADWKYVKIDVKAKMPTGRGVWPAIWLMPTDSVYGYWPHSGEIDIIEMAGFDPCMIHSSFITEEYNWRLGREKSIWAEIEAPYEKFHVYSIEWDSDKATILIDGISAITFENDGLHKATTWPFDQKFYLIMNIAVGGDWGGLFGVDPTIFPQQMVVDYVRVYKRK